MGEGRGKRPRPSKRESRSITEKGVLNSRGVGEHDKGGGKKGLEIEIQKTRGALFLRGGGGQKGGIQVRGKEIRGRKKGIRALSSNNHRGERARLKGGGGRGEKWPSENKKDAIWKEERGSAVSRTGSEEGKPHAWEHPREKTPGLPKKKKSRRGEGDTNDFGETFVPVEGENQIPGVHPGDFWQEGKRRQSVKTYCQGGSCLGGGNSRVREGEREQEKVGGEKWNFPTKEKEEAATQKTMFF